ncbi:DNA polymerase III subunit alpha [Metasolibacillus sp. FSL H7-0170]|uniref:DNA polymerase III subunit alpha n=1 Tax=Metasolibacillus sp. FSL H7-0170 TaxID=2921431 RepID=UPI0031580D06
MVVYPQIRTSADLLKSTIKIEALIPFLQQQKAEACAIVNSRLYGLLPFWHEMKKAGIHPVVGLVVNVQFAEEINLPLILYAQNNIGYRHLLKISSSVAIRKDETLPFRWLAGYADGCIAIIPALAEEARWLENDNRQLAEQLKQLFAERLFIGIERLEVAAPNEQDAVFLSEQIAVKIMAIHESTFMTKDDHFAYEIARAIDTGVKMGLTFNLKLKHRYVLTKEQWQQFFTDRPQWLRQTEQVLMSCHVTMEQQATFMPKFPVASGQTAEELLRERVLIGLQHRLQSAQLPAVYEQRMQHELGVICSMGYADYFLIVEDFMRFAREQQILTGPGRGSSASSLIAYALQITQVDPLQYDLLFERFLNPERVTLPDIDIDFVDTKRQEVIQYVANKYGQQHVAQIITFGTLSAKAVARDVARMLEFEPTELEKISKMIPNKPGIMLQDAYNESQSLRNWIDEKPERQRWFATAQKLEGLPRNASTHAAGVVLSPIPLVELVPIEEGHDQIFLTQWPMLEVEQVGLLKMDFLGLRNLTILEQIRRSVQYTHGKEIKFEDIPLQDQRTFKLLQAGDTAGIFQLESEGMRQALREIKPTHFLDIVAVNALYRPGPMDFIATYARRKHGQEQVTMPHPALEPVLGETYGVLIYQEQIMRIAHMMAGFSIGEADILRRAISKKNRQALERGRDRFIIGAQQKGYEPQVANEVYALIVRFADYGFPKSHAVAYSLISYQMAYLKAHYPVNFYAALLTNATGNTEKLVQILIEAKAKGITILPPSIQKSERHFKVENGQIRYSLSAIKNVSQPFLKSLIEVRNMMDRPFKDLFDLANSLSTAVFQQKAIEPLIKAGALDDFKLDRAVLLASIEAARKHVDFNVGKPKLAAVQPLEQQQKLQYEKEVLGLYLSEHPLTKWRATIQVNATTYNLHKHRDGQYVKILGIIEEIKQIRTKKGELMAFVELQDEYGSISATLFPKEFTVVQQQLEVNHIAYVEGVLEFRFGKPQLKVKLMRIQEI